MEKNVFLTSSEKKKVEKNKKEAEELKVHCAPSFKVVPRCSNQQTIHTRGRKKKVNTSSSTNITPFIQKEEEEHNKVFNGGKELFIYFNILSDVFTDDDEGNQKWYKINPNESSTSLKGKTQILSQICSIPTDTLPDRYSTIGCNSKLYVMGGYAGKQDLNNRGHIKNNVRSKVFVCDTLSTNPVWEECSSMKSCKIIPQLAVVDGKIFAFGSRLLINFSTKKPYAEVFDPLLNKWTALPSPPPDVHLGNVADSVFVKDRGEIIIFPPGFCRYYPRDAYRFNVKTHSWTRFSDPFKMPTDIYTTSVAVGDVVFRLQEKQLYACDLSKPKPIGHRVYGLEEEIKSSDWSQYRLFYIGNGKLCLTWLFDSKEHCDMTIIACLKFWVGMCNQKRCLQAVIDRCDHYLAQGCSVSLDCFAM